jgi:peptidoglycan/LPS O-acetylase OafA/YrhL
LLYLCHAPVLLAIEPLFGYGSPLHLDRHSVGWMVIGWVACIAVASAVYRWYEKPFMDLRDRAGQRSRKSTTDAA